MTDHGVQFCAESPGSPWKQTPGSSVNRNPTPHLNAWRTACTDLPHRRKHMQCSHMSTKTQLLYM